MNNNQIALKIAFPYARALFDLVKDTDTLYQVTLDIQNIKSIIFESSDLQECLQNRTLNSDVKTEILLKILNKASSQNLNENTIKFISILKLRNRIDILQLIIFLYLEIVYNAANSRTFQIISANTLSYGQRIRLIKKIQSIAKSNRTFFEYYIDTNVIGGLLIRNEGKIIDYTIKNKLKMLAKQLDTILEI